MEDVAVTVKFLRVTMWVTNFVYICISAEYTTIFSSVHGVTDFDTDAIIPTPNQQCITC